MRISFLFFCWCSKVLVNWLSQRLMSKVLINWLSRRLMFLRFCHPLASQSTIKTSLPPFILFYDNKAHEIHSWYISLILVYALDFIYETFIDICRNKNLFWQQLNLCWYFVIFLSLLYISILLLVLIMKKASSVWSCTFNIIYIYSPLSFWS